MIEQEREEVEREEDTRPKGDETTKPGRGDVDEEAIQKGLDKLDQAAGSE